MGRRCGDYFRVPGPPLPARAGPGLPFLQHAGPGEWGFRHCRATPGSCLRREIAARPDRSRQAAGQRIPGPRAL